MDKRNTILALLMMLCSFIIIAFLFALSLYWDFGNYDGEIYTSIHQAVDVSIHESEELVEPETKKDALSQRYLERDNVITVVLDPGHGGSDGGARNKNAIEKEQTLHICKLIKEYLKDYDIEVLLTRESDIEISKEDRVIYANEVYADVLVSIHRNNFKYSSAHGVEIWIGLANKKEDRDLATYIMDNIKTVSGTHIRGIETGSTTDRKEDYIVNRHSLMPSCLIELGFMSNKQDNYLFDNYDKEYAKAIGDGILTFLDIKQENANGEN